MNEPRRFGLGKGNVYPATAARALVNPVRHLLHPPRRLVRRMRLAPSDRVLELGCGPGWFSPALVSGAGRVHLADLQADMLRIAKARAPSATATVVDAMALPFLDRSFDAVLVAAVLGEIPDPGRALREVRRVLRPGGCLTVLETRTDPDFTSFARLCELAEAAGLEATRRHGRVAGYTAVFVGR